MNRRKKIESLLVIITGFIILFFVFKIVWFLLIAALIGFLGIISKVFIDKITWLWFKLAELFGWINSRILLSIVFFVFLFPVALLMRAIGKSSIQFKKNKNSYYHRRDHTYRAEDLENTW